MISGSNSRDLSARSDPIPTAVSRYEYDELLLRRDRVSGIFEGLIRERLKRWVTLARGEAAWIRGTLRAGGNDIFPWVDDFCLGNQGSSVNGEGEAL